MLISIAPFRARGPEQHTLPVVAYYYAMHVFFTLNPDPWRTNYIPFCIMVVQIYKNRCRSAVRCWLTCRTCSRWPGTSSYRQIKSAKVAGQERTPYLPLQWQLFWPQWASTGIWVVWRFQVSTLSPAAPPNATHGVHLRVAYVAVKWCLYFESGEHCASSDVLYTISGEQFAHVCGI